MSTTPANGFDFSVPAAATIAAPVDTLFFSLVAASALVTLAIVSVIVYFCIKYRRGASADRTNSIVNNIKLESVWIAVPTILFLILFCWAAGLYQQMFTPPPDAIDIFVVAKQWMWKVQHISGRQEIDELHVPLGKPVRLVMTSQDVIHSFFVPAFRLKQDILPGRYTAMWFQASKIGIYPLFCSEYCGTAHSQMGGTVVVMPPEQYESWLTGASAPIAGLDSEGAVLYRRFGCSGCHDSSSGLHAPPVERIYGNQVTLASGRQVKVDEQFLHDAIVDPSSNALAGYSAIMPSFRAELTDSQLRQIIKYIEASANGPRPIGAQEHPG